MKTLYTFKNGVEFAQNDQGAYCLTDGYVTDYIVFNEQGYIHDGLFQRDDEAMDFLSAVSVSLNKYKEVTL
jgi:hypothetical protein